MVQRPLYRLLRFSPKNITKLPNRVHNNARYRRSSAPFGTNVHCVPITDMCVHSRDTPMRCDKIVAQDMATVEQPRHRTRVLCAKAHSKSDPRHTTEPKSAARSSAHLFINKQSPTFSMFLFVFPCQATRSEEVRHTRPPLPQTCSVLDSIKQLARMQQVNTHGRKCAVCLA